MKRLRSSISARLTVAPLLPLITAIGICRLVSRVERIVSNLLTFGRTKKKILRSFRSDALLDDFLDQVGQQINLDICIIERRYQAAGHGNGTGSRVRRTAAGPADAKPGGIR